MPSSLYKIEEYTLFRSDRAASGGGVAMYIQSKFRPQKLNIGDIESDINQLWVKFKYNKLTFKVGVIYRPPSVPIAHLHFLYDDLADIIHDCDICILTGDLNINLLNKDSAESKFLYDILETFNLHQIIVDPTRVTENSESLIDLVITNDKQFIYDSGVMCCEPINTDHEAVFCTISCPKIKEYPPRTACVRNFNSLHD